MKKVLIILGTIVVSGIAWYALSPLLMSKHVDEALPTPTVPAPQSNTAASPTPSAAGQPTTQTVLSDPVPIVDTPLHPASGVVRLVKTGAETVVRYENYQTINGPDVRVYLATDLAATKYVDLGPIKGTEGNINYPVPAGVNVDDYRYALTWCEDFAVLFNSADLWANRAQ